LKNNVNERLLKAREEYDVAKQDVKDAWKIGSNRWEIEDLQSIMMRKGNRVKKLKGMINI